MSKEEIKLKNVGRLTEEQTVNFFKKIRFSMQFSFSELRFIFSVCINVYVFVCRENPESDRAEIGKEFGLNDVTVEKLLTHVRWPLTARSKHKIGTDEDYPIAR